MTTTIFGTIKSVEAFTTKSNLGVIKVKIADGSGSINLSFLPQNLQNMFLKE